ncbi:basic helix-loop-helix (bHLH) DNA-binding superfamily protein [Artemisia annua]|uniref:Basic helix-loop-helix (BHLH) DNA-binding superfamily protein n=1 Tax=Artemisia annua TaxID=35608 RepID=A0A2U1LX24_ARTAN|nr:basic helix-loop-helix (bHLH) DNA-binding superfamily protein [Artemisia annua]
MENLRQRLAMAVKSIQWSYAIFWSTSSTEQGVLTWCDGYYNGDIKTRKTIQAEGMNEDDDDGQVGLQRTEQLKQLYESLSAAETHHYEPQARRPSAALSPEDLTDTEWYFLVCMTFEFGYGQGLPGRTLAKNTTSWLSDAHLADSKVFTRSLLAKSASIQTVVCIPYLEGIVEFGITERVLEEQNIIQRIKSLIFIAPPQKIHEIPLESCSAMLDHDLIHNNLSTSRAGDLWSDDDSRYQCVLSKIFKNTQRSAMGPDYRNSDSEKSAFVSWKNYDGMEWKGSSSQMLLKNVLYEVPKMHENHLSRYYDKNGNLDRMQEVAVDDVNDVNHRFSVLSSIVPSRGKVDKVSLLDDTINYLKTLERKVEVLQSRKKSHDVRERTSDNYANKRKASCALEDIQEECSSDCITVSAIEKDVTIEIRCKWRENMMVQVFDAMSSLNLESHSVCSSTVDGILTLSIETKLKKFTTSTAKMIRQALQRVIGRY